MKRNALTQMAAKNLAIGKYADGQGLWLVKRERSAGKWVLRLVVKGVRREMGLGRWPDVSIAEARERAAEARKVGRGNDDPIEARRASRRVVRRLTVGEAIKGCYEARQAQLKGDGEAGRWMSPLSVHVIPKIGKLPIEELDQHRLKELLDPLWHTKPDTARKALNRLGLTVQHAAALGLAVDMQACMKARALLGQQRHEVEHIPSLSYQDAPAFYKWLRAKETVAARALRFLILTVARTSEVRFAMKEQVADGIWTIRPEATKLWRSGVVRRVPLGKEAVGIVELCPAPCLFTGPSGKPISDATMAKLMKDEGYEARPHGFRSTFRTWAEEATDADYETKETCLGHIVDTGVVGAYQRSDRLEKRRALLAQWETFLTNQSKG